MAFDLTARLRVEDKASAGFRKATEAAKTYRDSMGRLQSVSDKYVKDADKASGSSKKFGASLTSLKLPIGGMVTKLGALAGAIGGAVVAYKALGVVTSSVGKAMSFEAQLSSIQALTGATNDEMAKMQTLALKMGASTKYNALEAAQGIEELLKAGLTPATVQAGGLEAALNLATAGGLGLAEAAEIMSTSLNAFKKDGISAAKASDILAGTANASATGVEDLRYSLAAVSSVAAGVGLSFEDTNIALGLFANNGIKGSDAGTSLKTMLSNLQPTTKDQISLFKKLGLMTAKGSNAFYDSAGNIKSLEDISGTLRKSMKKLTNQQRSMALETLFGSDAIRAGNILFGEGAEGVKKFRKEMSQVTALDVAKKKMDNAAGAVEQFKGALETLQISALLPTMPIIKDLATAAANAVEKYSPAITAAMQKGADKLRDFMNTNYLNNDEFMSLNFADKIKVVATDIQGVFDKWWDSSGKVTFTAVSDNITSTLLASLENSVPTITKIGVDIGAGLLSGMVDGMRDSKSLGWVFEGIDMFTPEYGKKLWKSVGIDVGTKDVPDARGKPNGRASAEYLPTERMSQMLKEGTFIRPPATPAQSVSKSVGVNVTGNTFNVRKDTDIDAVATQLYGLIKSADDAMGGKNMSGGGAW